MLFSLRVILTIDKRGLNNILLFPSEVLSMLSHLALPRAAMFCAYCDRLLITFGNEYGRKAVSQIGHHASGSNLGLLLFGGDIWDRPKPS